MFRLAALLAVIGGIVHTAWETPLREKYGFGEKEVVEEAPAAPVIPVDQYDPLPAPAPRPLSGTHAVTRALVCPICNGEGGVMVRRSAGVLRSGDGRERVDGTGSGSIRDVRHSCGVCMGTGGRNLGMPAGAEICVDCAGMGKRVIVRGGGSERATSQAHTGYWQHPPQATGCVRCLNKGYIRRFQGS